MANARACSRLRERSSSQETTTAPGTVAIGQWVKSDCHSSSGRDASNLVYDALGRFPGVFCQIFVGRFGVSFSPFERLFLGRFGFGQSCGLSVIA